MSNALQVGIRCMSKITLQNQSFVFIFWRLPGLWAGCSEREIRNIWAKLTCKVFELRQSACVENIWVRKMLATFFPSLLYFEFRVLSCWFLFCTTSEIFRVMNIIFRYELFSFVYKKYFHLWSSLNTYLLTNLFFDSSVQLWKALCK